MSKSWAIFRRDLMRIVRNPMALVVAIGICVVPCLYAWINLIANWDPYENTSDVPVAIVNEDMGAEVADMGHMSIGDMMVEKLADNDKIGWRFEDRATALEDVNAGRCYGAIVIPADFTKTLAGILDGHTDKAHLTYYVNEKVNAIAPKVTDTGATTIESTIDDQFVAVCGKVITEKLGNAAANFTGKAHDATDDVAAALTDAHDTLAEVDSGLSSFSDKLGGARDSLRDASARLAALEGSGKRASDTVAGVLDRFQTLRQDTTSRIDSANDALGRGANALSQVSTGATSDLAALAGDLSSACGQINDAIRTLENDLTDGKALESKVSSTRDRISSLDPTLLPDVSVKNEVQRQLDGELDLTVQLTSTQAAKIDELRSIASRLGTAASEVASLADKANEGVNAATDSLLGARTSSIATSISQASTALDTFVSVGRRLETAARVIDPIISQTVSVADKLANTFDGAQAALTGTRTSLGEVTEMLANLSDAVAAISASEVWNLLDELSETNPERVHDFLVSPVEIEQMRLYPIENYASGITPFFTSLALWVGGIALIAIFKLEIDEEGLGLVRPWQATVGRWLLFVTLGALQAVICCTGDLLIGVQCTHPWAFYLTAIVSSLSFVSIIFSLSVAFKHLGKALAFTLIILQVPGSSGMYPIEMMPPFFRTIGPWLPFTYSNNAFREAIGGFYGANLAYNLAVLIAFVLPSLVIGISLRSHLVNVNSLFDRRLRETDHLMVSEPYALDRHRFRLATVVKATIAPQEYHEAFERTTDRFEQLYPSLVRRGIFVLLLTPLVLIALTFVFEDARLNLMAALVCILIAVYAYLIVVEYLHDHVTHKRGLTDLTPEQMDQVMNEALREELMPYVSIDALLEMRARRKGHKGAFARLHDRIHSARDVEDDEAEAGRDLGVTDEGESMAKGGDAR